jgi:hypothetical protein
MRSGYREWWENLRETIHLEDLGIDNRILNLIFNMWDKGWEAWTVLIWLRIGTGGRLLCFPELCCMQLVVSE